MPLTINCEIIPEEVLNEEFHVIKAHYERLGNTSCCERDSEFRGYARDNITARVLLSQEALRLFPHLDDSEVSATVERLIEEQGGREQFFAHAGLTPDQEHLVKEEIGTSLRLDKLLQSAWRGAASPTESALQTWYDNNIAQFMSAPEIRATHLFKHVEKVENREPTYQKLCALRILARAGTDFDAIAREHTDKQDKLIDLGWFKRGEFNDDFDIIMFSLGDDEMSPVFASHYGFHLAKVTGVRPAAPRAFNDVRNEVLEMVTAEHRSALTRTLVENLKSCATICD